MKTRVKIVGLRILAISVLGIMSQAANSQHPCAGHWEGDFMGDYKTIINLEQGNDNAYSGRIQMFDESGMIQDDELSKIVISDTELTFYIDAKETDFKGVFNEDISELSGNFIFPDNSLHPITLQKVPSGKMKRSSSEVTNPSKPVSAEGVSISLN